MIQGRTMGFFDFLHGGKNPSRNALPYTQNIPGMTMPYMSPFFNAGVGALPELQNQYSGLLKNPAEKLNQIGAGYQQSPGFKFALDQALGASGQAAAAGGMAGSPAHQQEAMQLGTNMANQDYNNYMQHALGLYNSGLSGQQGLYEGGRQTGNSMADMIANAMQQSGNLAFRGQQDRNAGTNSMLSGLGRGLGALSAFTPFSSLNSLSPWGGGMSSSMYGGS